MTGQPEPRQLALALPHDESLSRDDFLEGESNAEALALISARPDWPNRVMWLMGPEGSGKSHLASIWSVDAGARVMSMHHLDSDNVPSSLATGALVIEDAGSGEMDERALFHLLNLAREDEAFVLITSRHSPAALPIALRDLASRLRALPVVELSAPDDAMLRALIVKYGDDRQLGMDEALVGYIATRVERSAAAARRAVALLDSEGLRLGRAVNRVLAAELLRGR